MYLPLQSTQSLPELGLYHPVAPTPFHIIASDDVRRASASPSPAMPRPRETFAQRVAAAGPHVARAVRRCAIHEAGHAIAFLAKQLRPDGAVVRLEYDEQRGYSVGGQCYFPGQASRSELRKRDSTACAKLAAEMADLEQLCTDIVFCLMGGLAAELNAGHSPKVHEHNDYDAAYGLLAFYGFRRGIIADQLNEAISVLRLRCSAVARIADALLMRGELTSADITELFRSE